MALSGPVTEWKMTEEERLAYIAKHPIVPTEPPSGSKFAKVNEMKRQNKVDSSVSVNLLNNEIKRG